MRPGKILGLAAAAAVGLASMTQATKANTIQTIVTAQSGNTYTVSIQLTPNNGLSNDTNFESGLIIPDIMVGGATFSFSNGFTPTSDWVITGTDATGATLPNVTNNGVATTIQGSGGPFDTASAADLSGVNDLVLRYVGTGVDTTGGQRVLLTGTITTTASLIGRLTLGRDTDGSGTADVGVSEHFTVTAVPVPEAAWMGMSTLAGAGAFGALRKRLRRA